MYAGGFLGPFGGGMVVVLVPEFREVFDVSTSVAAMTITVYLTPYALLQLVSGTLGERYGQDRLLRIGYLIYAIASLAAVVLTSIVPFLVARAVQGGANAFISPLALARLAAVTPEERMGRAMGTFASIQIAGGVMAPLIGGLAGAIDYRLAFGAAAVAALVLMVIVPQRHGAVRNPNPPRLRGALTPRTGWLALGAFTLTLCLSGLAVIVSLKGADEFGLSADARGLLLAGFGFAGVFASRPAGRLLDRIGQRRVALIGVTASATAVVGLGVSNGLWLFAACWLLAGATGALLSTTLSTLMVSASAENRGGAISIVGTSRFAGSASAPVAWIAVYETSPQLAFMVAAAGSSVLMFALARAIRARTTTSWADAAHPQPTET